MIVVICMVKNFAHLFLVRRHLNFVTDRKNLIPKYFFNRPITLKLSSLFNKKKPETVRKLCKLIDIINKKISFRFLFVK